MLSLEKTLPGKKREHLYHTIIEHFIHLPFGFFIQMYYNKSLKNSNIHICIVIVQISSVTVSRPVYFDVHTLPVIKFQPETTLINNPLPETLQTFGEICSLANLAPF